MKVEDNGYGATETNYEPQNDLQAIGLSRRKSQKNQSSTLNDALQGWTMQRFMSRRSCPYDDSKYILNKLAWSTRLRPRTIDLFVEAHFSMFPFPSLIQDQMFINS